MRMKTEKFGIISLDRLLGGGITPGSAILITSEHPATNKGAFTGYFALEQIGRDQGRVFVVEYSFPPHHFFDLPEIVASPSFLQSAITAKRYFVINCYGPVTYPEKFSFQDAIIDIDKPNDIAKVKYVLDKSREDLCGPTETIRWIFDDITNMFISIGEEAKVLRFFRQMFQTLKNKNDLGLFYLDRPAHSTQFVSALENMADIIINLKVKEISGIFIPHLRIIKNRYSTGQITSTEVPYSFTHEGIRIQTKMLGDFEVLKTNLSLTPQNNIELFGVKYLMIPTQQYLQILQTMYETLDYSEYCTRNFEIGKVAGKEFLTYVNNFFKTSELDRPYAIMRQIGIFGNGKVIAQTFNLEKGVVVIHIENMYGFKAIHPIHQEAAGFLTAILESITGEIWDAIETKCTATGDEYCELVASPARELGFINLDLQKTKEQLAIDTEGTLSLMGIRVLLMPRGTLIHILESAEDIVGVERASEIMYHAGERMALEFAQQMSERFNLEGAAIFRSYAQIVGVRGWGITEIQEFDLETGYARATLKNSIISTSMTQKHIESDAMVAGVIAGIMEFITKRKTICREVKCIAKGDKVCEFIAEPLTAEGEERIFNP
ncbi:MAG TPA: V4R domain-containing protein [Candidatus Deferrimicrobium sp.]|nr:V4R domain-containing protein [Candidatus Deferrimicrobium sp.]